MQDVRFVPMGRGGIKKPLIVSLLRWPIKGYFFIPADCCILSTDQTVNQMVPVTVSVLTPGSDRPCAIGILSIGRCGDGDLACNGSELSGSGIVGVVDTCSPRGAIKGDVD